jgi:hypothetical protein
MRRGNELEIAGEWSQLACQSQSYSTTTVYHQSVRLGDTPLKTHDK